MCVIICISWNLIQGVGCSPELPAFAVMTNMARQAEIISGQHVYISCLMSSAGYTHTSTKLCHNELSTGGWRSTWWGHPQWKKTRQEFGDKFYQLGNTCNLHCYTVCTQYTHLTLSHTYSQRHWRSDSMSAFYELNKCIGMKPHEKFIYLNHTF